jgi:8-oxo-dGTP pyrophosphatase MutT (NUDIX family)
MRRAFYLIPEVHLLLERDGEVLLLKRANTGYEDGNYSLVAGHMDGGETAREAMAREAMEEAGLLILPEDLDLVHIIHRKSEQERLSFFFRPRKYQRQPLNMEPDKCDELAWFASGALPDNLIPYIRHALEQCQRHQVYSEFGW